MLKFVEKVSDFMIHNSLPPNSLTLSNGYTHGRTYITTKATASRI